MGLQGCDLPHRVFAHIRLKADRIEGNQTDAVALLEEAEKMLL